MSTIYDVNSSQIMENQGDRFGQYIENYASDWFLALLLSATPTSTYQHFWNTLTVEKSLSAITSINLDGAGTDLDFADVTPFAVGTNWTAYVSGSGDQNEIMQVASVSGSTVTFDRNINSITGGAITLTTSDSLFKIQQTYAEDGNDVPTSYKSMTRLSNYTQIFPWVVSATKSLLAQDTYSIENTLDQQERWAQEEALTNAEIATLRGYGESNGTNIANKRTMTGFVEVMRANSDVVAGGGSTLSVSLMQTYLTTLRERGCRGNSLAIIGSPKQIARLQSETDVRRTPIDPIGRRTDRMIPTVDFASEGEVKLFVSNNMPNTSIGIMSMNEISLKYLGDSLFRETPLQYDRGNQELYTDMEITLEVGAPASQHLLVEGLAE